MLNIDPTSRHYDDDISVVLILVRRPKHGLSLARGGHIIVLIRLTETLKKEC